MDQDDHQHELASTDATHQRSLEISSNDMYVFFFISSFPLLLYFSHHPTWSLPKSQVQFHSLALKLGLRFTTIRPSHLGLLRFSKFKQLFIKLPSIENKFLFAHPIDVIMGSLFSYERRFTIPLSQMPFLSAYLRPILNHPAAPSTATLCLSHVIPSIHRKIHSLTYILG